MAIEEKYINTATDITKTSTTITINTCYVPDDGNDVYLFIADANQVVNGVSFLEGYEGVVNNNFDGDFYIDSDGNLIVNSPYANDLEIDNNGDLILTI